MLTILFDIFPATGHYNATFKLAKLLKARGHRIVFIGPEEFSDKINALGFQFHLVHPHIIAQDIAAHGFIAYFIERLVDSFSSKRYKAALRRWNEYENLIKTYSPDLIVLDEHYIYKAIFYHRVKVKVVAVQSMTAKERGKWVPPFQSTLIPKVKFGYKILIHWLWIILLLKKRKDLMLNTILACGQDNFSLMKKIALHFDFPFYESINYQLSLGTGFKNIPIFKLTPRDFDFPRQTIWNHYHVGPLVDLEREKEITDLRYLEVMRQLARTKEEGKNSIIIYCSLGTVTDAEIKLCDIFFNKIVGVCKRNIRYKIILSVGKHYNVTRLLPKPPNLYIFQQVPQIDLLSRCDLMINHGGINSISECVFAGIPMIAFPLSPHWDQNGCGARVAYHNLGLRGSIVKDSVNDISKKINLILEDYISFKENVLKMRAKFNVLNNSTGVVAILEDMAGRKEQFVKDRLF